MNIKRNIDKNGKLIFYIVITIIFIFFGIKSLNSHLEVQEIKEKEQIELNQNNAIQEPTIIENKIESNSIEVTIKSFINYCNNREIENAYKMLTEECKNAMFSNIQDFETNYINNIFNEKRTFDLERWSTYGNKITYLVTLYGELLATGGIENSTQEYWTFVIDKNGNFKLNINNYIYGEDLNIEKSNQNIKVKISHVDIYENYQELQITFTNNSNKTICLTGNELKNNIYLQDSNGVNYMSLNSGFDSGKTILLNPNSSETFDIKFNKNYNINNLTRYLILNNVILDYDEYLNSEDKTNYLNKTSIKIDYRK